MGELVITSSAFEHEASIPSLYTCDGDDINPPLKIEGIPKQTESLVIIFDDPDAPKGTWVHWVVFNIEVTNYIEEDSVPGEQGLNDFKKHNYGGPCPPLGIHRYFFKVYALDTTLELNKSATKEDVEMAMEGHVIAMGELIGLYEKMGLYEK